MRAPPLYARIASRYAKAIQDGTYSAGDRLPSVGRRGRVLRARPRARGRAGAGVAELRRVLRPGAPALLAFHVGREVLHVDSFLGHTVDLDFHLFPMAAILGALREAGLEPDMHLERAPYVPHEHPSTRAYVLARRRP